MSILNKIKPKARVLETQDAHLNWMGGPSYFLKNPLDTLRLAVSSSFFGEPMYYQADKTDKRPHRNSPAQIRARLTEAELTYLRDTLNAIDPQAWRSLSPKQVMEQTIDAALAFDAEQTLQEAVRLRQEAHIRATPQVILVRAGHHPKVKGTGLVTKYAGQIIARADEPAMGLAYQLSEYGRPVPNSLKKAWKSRLEQFDAYQLAKYRMESRLVKTTDVVSLVHAKSEAIDRLMKDELKTTGETWEAIVSAEGSTREVWEKALDQMGHMALLRNLRNLLEKDVPTNLFLSKLIVGAATGKQLPFRYYSAYKAVEKLAKPNVMDALETCLEAVMGSLPHFAGRVASLCDNSGSAWGTTTSSMGTMHVAEIANLTGVLTGKASEEGHVGVFGDRLEMFPVRKKDSTFSLVDRIGAAGKEIGGGTENGIWLFWDRAIHERQHWDHVFVYSDMQAGHGGLYGNDRHAYRDFVWRGNGAYIDVPKLIAAYRRQVNPKVMVYLAQVAGYTDTILPEFYDRTFILGGWGEGLLRFAAQMAELYETRK
jgi:hypothetical protein